MTKLIQALLAASIIFPLLGHPYLWAQAPIGKVVDSYLQGTTTYMLIEANRLLNTSQTLYLHGNIPVIVREIMSMREAEGIGYYRAYSPKKVRVLPGESVFLEVPQKKKGGLFDFERKAIFMKKKYGQITLAEGDKVIINRGSLHNVDKRDIYMVRNAKGKTKGKVELYGIGDFISVGKTYRSFEDESKSEDIAIDDSVEFMGNRKILGFGFIAATINYDNTRGVAGTGNLWTIFLRKGWSYEFLLGGFERELRPANVEAVIGNFWMPMWLKKNFFYPQTLSPFVSVGFSYENHYEARVKPSEIFSKKYQFLPMASIGLELFSGSLFHPRLELQYYYLPDFEYQGNRYKTSAPFYVAGATVNW